MNTSVDDHEYPRGEPQRQAWVWLRLLHSGDVTTWDAEGFQRWLHANPAHRAAFSEAKRRWAIFKPVAGEVLRARAETAEFHERSLHGQSFMGRRAFLGAAVSAAAVAGVAVAFPPADLWPSPAEWGADYRTSTGEQRVVALNDVTQVTLNTQTSIRRQTTGDETVGIDLLAGEAAIDLSAGGKRFAVSAGVGRSLAEAGRFEVRHLEGKVCVTCIDGAVRVDHPSGSRSLQAGQQTVYDKRLLAGIVGIDTAKASAWRSGELVFNQTKLIDVLAEINRYRPGRVLLMNDAVRNQPVSGSFYIASLDQALSQLQHTFDLNSRSLPGGLLVLS